MLIFVAAFPFQIQSFSMIYLLGQLVYTTDKVWLPLKDLHDFFL